MVSTDNFWSVLNFFKVENVKDRRGTGRGGEDWSFDDIFFLKRADGRISFKRDKASY